MLFRLDSTRSLTSMWVAAAVTVVFLGLVGSAHAAPVQNEIFEFTLVDFVPCANDGQGEFFEGTGRRRITITLTIDGNGVTHFNVADNMMDFFAVGQETGDVYRLHFAANIQSKGVLGTEGSHFTITRSSGAVSKGSGANLIFQVVNNVFIDANGVLRIDEPRFNAKCQ